MLSLLTGCFSPPIPEIDTGNQRSAVTPIRALDNEFTDGYYRTALPYYSSPTRGLIFSHINNSRSRAGNRFDIEELELSLMRAATDFFDPDDFYFQDGQYLSRDLVSQLLRPEGSPIGEFPDIGLNPAIGTTVTVNNETIESTEDQPIHYLSYLLEQNFVTIDEDGERILEGVSIGLALNPYVQNNLEMNDSELIAEGERIAAALIERLQEQEELAEVFESVPIMIGLYILESSTSVVPGRFVAKTLIPGNSWTLSNWGAVEERTYLVDSRITEVDLELVEQFNYFQNTINEFYSHHHGIIGMAQFIDNNLYRLEITVNVTFYGLGEKLTFHQLVAELIAEFSPNYDVTVIVRASDEIYGTVKRSPNGEVTVQRYSW